MLRETGYRMDPSTYDELFNSTKNKRYAKYREELTADHESPRSMQDSFEMSNEEQNAGGVGNSPPPDDTQVATYQSTEAPAIADADDTGGSSQPEVETKPESPPRTETPPVPWYHVPLDLTGYYQSAREKVEIPELELSSVEAEPDTPSPEPGTSPPLAVRKSPTMLVISPPPKPTQSGKTDGGESKRYKQEIIKQPLPRAPRKPVNTQHSPKERPPTPMRFCDQEHKPQKSPILPAHTHPAEKQLDVHDLLRRLTTEIAMLATACITLYRECAHAQCP